MSVSLAAAVAAQGGRVAIVDEAGEHGYDALAAASGGVAGALLAGAADLAEARVAFMVRPGFGYPAVQLGIWRAGGIAVPLCLTHPAPELEYVLEDTGAAIVVADAEFEERLRPLAEAVGARFVTTAAALAAAGDAPLPAVEPDRRAMILYTSGTTSRPKGVVTTHANLDAQIESLVTAWEWTAADRILHVLPLHHTHGIVNVLLCALRAGAVCELEPGFDAARVWDRFRAGGLSLFMAVPTIYARLIAAWEESPPAARGALRRSCRALRLMVSGSAALPVTTFAAWRGISGHELLERYGMTEIGMALSNPLHGERRPGTVGQPLPGVEVRLLDDDGRPVETEGVAGEIHVRGEGVFLEYWNRPDATAAAFRDGWFRTGDVAVIEAGYYRILGRNSVDIIKSGGYKVSALEIEEVLRTHPHVSDCAVVGLEDAEWGEVVSAAVVPAAGGSAAVAELKGWLAERLAPYKLPRRWVFVGDLPRNVMGKVTKPDVKSLFA
jgi:malonyl-CoA/methylmalonyl-CoA synthetase